MFLLLLDPLLLSCYNFGCSKKRIRDSSSRIVALGSSKWKGLIAEADALFFRLFQQLQFLHSSHDAAIARRVGTAVARRGKEILYSVPGAILKQGKDDVDLARRSRAGGLQHELLELLLVLLVGLGFFGNHNGTVLQQIVAPQFRERPNFVGAGCVTEFLGECLGGLAIAGAVAAGVSGGAQENIFLDLGRTKLIHFGQLGKDDLHRVTLVGIPLGMLFGLGGSTANVVLLVRSSFGSVVGWLVPNPEAKRSGAEQRTVVLEIHGAYAEESSPCVDLLARPMVVVMVNGTNWKGSTKVFWCDCWHNRGEWFYEDTKK